MTPVVADTTPLRYLVEIGYESLLSQLFTKVWIPRAVAHELQGRGAPESVRQWAGRLLSWVEVRELANPVFEREASGLDYGEWAAIQLAREIHANLLLIDEALARLANTNFRRTDELFEQTRQRARMPTGNA